MRAWSLFLFLLFALIESGHSQDPQFSQYFNNPVYLNPAFTGETRVWKFSLNSRFQWMNSPAQYTSHAVTAEYNISANQTGLGFQMLYDQTGTGNLTYISYNGLYSYKALLSRKMKLNFGLKAAFNQRYFDIDQLTFANELAGTNNVNSEQDFYRNRANYFDLGAGIAIMTRDWWIGISLDHLNRPNYSLSLETSRLPIKYSAHASYRFKLKRDLKRRVIKSLVITGNFKAQKEWDQLDVGGYYEYKKVTLGILYRGLVFKETVPNNINQDAVIAYLAYRYYGLRIAYSYDITISKIWADTGGSHEFAIITELPFKPNKRKRSRRMMPCPKF
jgi:type IX secretion system PorP/SprF family membrane protein